MKKLQKISSLLMLALTSLLLLGACQKNSSKSKTDHSASSSQTKQGQNSTQGQAGSQSS
ncbi:hypothetical protein HMPREF9176_0971 [Streptococcus downei F0415]|uniref:Lipoprotein n=1 Tax=Streptococcus downei MFe28 TaxID=764290 RepID=A0A380JBW1_STRDO|nr:hypothetical protein HMPREF9176_0971 [Streptococcus downei F0415]SUN35353.1 Uncharacterised protein [Streptococcus downei MFe28]